MTTKLVLKLEHQFNELLVKCVELKVGPELLWPMMPHLLRNFMFCVHMTLNFRLPIFYSLECYGSTSSLGFMCHLVQALQYIPVDLYQKCFAFGEQQASSIN